MPRLGNYTKIPRPILWLIQGGTVSVGDPEIEDASPVFSATVPSFYISKAPLTNEQYEAFDSLFVRSPRSPGDRDLAVGLSWGEAVSYCQWYERLSGRPTRLPTESEWEFACRGGTLKSRFWGENCADRYAYHSGNTTSGVLGSWERLRPNPVGLHSMLGGVWEWTASDYAPYPGGSSARFSEERKVLRGGCWRDDSEQLDAARRRAELPDSAPDDAGFRILRPFTRGQ